MIAYIPAIAVTLLVGICVEFGRAWLRLFTGLMCGLVAVAHLLVKGNNDLLQPDVLFGMLLLLLCGLMINGAREAALKVRGPSHAALRLNLRGWVSRTLIWAAALLAAALVGRDVEAGKVVPLLREDAIFTGAVAVACAGIAIVLEVVVSSCRSTVGAR